MLAQDVLQSGEKVAPAPDAIWTSMLSRHVIRVWPAQAVHAARLRGLLAATAEPIAASNKLMLNALDAAARVSRCRALNSQGGAPRSFLARVTRVAPQPQRMARSNNAVPVSRAATGRRVRFDTLDESVGASSGDHGGTHGYVSAEAGGDRGGTYGTTAAAAAAGPGERPARGVSETPDRHSARSDDGRVSARALCDPLNASRVGCASVPAHPCPPLDSNVVVAVDVRWRAGVG